MSRPTIFCWASLSVDKSRRVVSLSGFCQRREDHRALGGEYLRNNYGGPDAESAALDNVSFQSAPVIPGHRKLPPMAAERARAKGKRRKRRRLWRPTCGRPHGLHLFRNGRRQRAAGNSGGGMGGFSGGSRGGGGGGSKAGSRSRSHRRSAPASTLPRPSP